MKKILSVTLAILLIATSFSMLSLCVSAETLAAGSYPYADKGVKAPVVNTSTTDEVYAADGFRTIVNADALTDEDFYNTFRPHLNKSTTHVVSGKTYMTTSLVDYSETDDNVYGTSGKAVKVAYISGGAGSVTPANETTAQKMHCIRIVNNISILGEWKDSAAIGFWVKTEYPVYIAVRLPVNTSSTNNCFIVSDKISVPAGESFIEIPLANFKTLGDGFVALNSAGNISISNVDIYFCGQETFTDTRDMYIDNYGYTSGYSGYKAVHDVGFKEITLTTSNWKINSAHAPNTSVSVDANAAYSHSGYTNVAANTSAIKVEYSNMNSISDTAGKVRLYYEGKMQLSSTAPYIYGEDSIIAFWVRADQPMSLLINYLDYGTKNETSAQYQTKSLTVDIPVGESIVKIKMSEMAPSGVTFDYRYAYQFMITAKTNNYSIAGKTSGTIYFDAFGFYDESYEPPVVPDTKVTHADDFTEVALNSAKLKTLTSTPEAITLSYDDNAAYSHSGSTNLEADTSAIKVEYAQMASTGYAVRFYYDASLKLNSEAPYIYGSDSVLSFWVRADQPMSLNYNYYDYCVSAGKNVQSTGKTISIPAGESIVRINMSEMAPSGVDFDYRQAYQLMITIRTNDDSYKNNGVVYFDAFGFYDADPTNDIPVCKHINTTTTTTEPTYFTEGESTTVCDGCGETVSTVAVPATDVALTSSEEKYADGKLTITLTYSEDLLEDIDNGAEIYFNYSIGGYNPDPIKIDTSELATGTVITLEGFNIDRINAELTYYLTAEYTGVDTTKLAEDTTRKLTVANDVELDSKTSAFVNALNADGANTVVSAKIDATTHFAENTITADLKEGTMVLNFIASDELVAKLGENKAYTRTNKITVTIDGVANKYEFTPAVMRKSTTINISGMSFEQLNGRVTIDVEFIYEAATEKNISDTIVFEGSAAVAATNTPVANAFAEYIAK